MNYTEARSLRDANKHLERIKDKGKTRTLLIVPIADKGMSETINAYRSFNTSLEAIYARYTVFSLMVF